MALESHLITVRRLEKYINDVIGKKANLPDTSKTIIGNISQINSNKQDKTDNTLATTSKSIVGAINEINSDLTNNTCVNLLNPIAQTQTINGVTFTNNGDGTYTVNGTANALAYIVATISSPVDLIPFRNKDIRIVGCPTGGGANAYQFHINIYNASNGDVARVIDYGGGSTYHVPSNAHHAHIVLVVQNGYTANNLLFKPMITTDLNAKYDDYVPYTGDSGRLNEDVSNKQNKTDNALTTVAKTIVGAINELNSDLTWKLAGRVKGNETINIPTSFKELHIVIKCPSANEAPIFTVDHLINNLEFNNLSSGAETWLVGGGSLTDTNNFRVITKINTAHTQIQTANCIVNNVDYLPYTHTEVYYR